MRIMYSFWTFKDLSPTEKGADFLALLDKHSLSICKTGAFEPVRHQFERDKMSSYWMSPSSDGKFHEGSFLFRGDENLKFSGMVSWNKGLPPKSKVMNVVYIVINMPKTRCDDQLIEPGDDLFNWSQAEYGYITEITRELFDEKAGNIFTSIIGLHWVNYFSSSYIDNPDFHLPDNRVMLGQGARLQIAARPDASLVDDAQYKAKIVEQIGLQWFWDGRRKVVLRAPNFDTSEIVREA